MLRLTYARYGSTGVLRRYQHAKFGLIETVTTWREPGAHIIRIETERHRQEWRAMIDRSRHWPVQLRKSHSKGTVKTACGKRG